MVKTNICLLTAWTQSQ